LLDLAKKKRTDDLLRALEIAERCDEAQRPIEGDENLNLLDEHEGNFLDQQNDPYWVEYERLRQENC
jgi:hypothetical protein